LEPTLRPPLGLRGEDIRHLLGEGVRIEAERVAQTLEEPLPGGEAGVRSALGAIDDRGLYAGLVGQLQLRDAAL
jgi:hypothetical protein